MKDVVFIGCGVLGIVALMVGTDILEEVVFKKMSSISATVRNQWNNRAIESFYSSPLIGVGYKQSRASSIITCQSCNFFPHGTKVGHAAIDFLQHGTGLDAAAIEESRDLVQIVPNVRKLPCNMRGDGRFNGFVFLQGKE